MRWCWWARWCLDLSSPHRLQTSVTEESAWQTLMKLSKFVPSQNSMFQAQWTPRISCPRLTSWRDSGIPSWSRFASFVLRFNFHLSSISALCRLHFGGAHLHCHWTYEIWQSTRVSPGIYPPNFWDLSKQFQPSLFLRARASYWSYPSWLTCQHRWTFILFIILICIISIIVVLIFVIILKVISIRDGWL